MGPMEGWPEKGGEFIRALVLFTSDTWQKSLTNMQTTKWKPHNLR